jgi:hypothetical protein
MRRRWARRRLARSRRCRIYSIRHYFSHLSWLVITTAVASAGVV